MALGSVIGAAASAATSFGLGKLFGGKSSSLSSFSPATLNAGGLSGSGGSITASPERMGLVGNIASLFPEQANILKGLRESVAPGMSKLREARLAEVEGARTRAIGNLKDNLSRRRVLGSSFGNDAIARSEAEFGKAKSEVQAETFLQELDLTMQTTEAEFTARRGEFQTHLDELNLQAEVGTQLASGATAQLGANARLKAELDARASAGAGKFFEPLANQVGKSVGGLFNVQSSTQANPWAYNPA